MSHDREPTVTKAGHPDRCIFNDTNHDPSTFMNIQKGRKQTPPRWVAQTTLLGGSPMKTPIPPPHTATLPCRPLLPPAWALWRGRSWIKNGSGSSTGSDLGGHVAEGHEGDGIATTSSEHQGGTSREYNAMRWDAKRTRGAPGVTI